MVGVKINLKNFGYSKFSDFNLCYQEGHAFTNEYIKNNMYVNVILHHLFKVIKTVYAN